MEHFERIRQTFESVDKKKQDGANPPGGPQTIGDALEALNLGDAVDGPVGGGPVTNGEHVPAGTGKGKGKQGGPPAKGKGKGKHKMGSMPNGDSDSSLDGPTSRAYDDVGADEEYIVRTDGTQ